MVQRGIMEFLSDRRKGVIGRITKGIHYSGATLLIPISRTITTTLVARSVALPLLHMEKAEEVIYPFID